MFEEEATGELLACLTSKLLSVTKARALNWIYNVGYVAPWCVTYFTSIPNGAAVSAKSISNYENNLIKYIQMIIAIVDTMLPVC